MRNWAEVTMNKYQCRLGKKSGTDDETKIKTFYDYIVFLDTQIIPTYLEMLEGNDDPTTVQVYKALGIEMDYTL
jgi:hypothetical protein